MSKGTKFLTALFLAGSASLMASSLAHAQNQPASSDNGKIEEVVVTAAKRSSTVQQTPISVTAVSGQDILARGITDFNYLAITVPGISLKSSGPGQTEFEMRGLTSSGGNSPTVGFYLDDVPLTAPAAAQNGKVVIDPDLYDLSRVEVLRGPQGTLYGSGSMGGTIKLITNQPTTDGFEATVQSIDSGTDGGGFNHGENVMVNIPLADNLALRVVGSEAYTSGWIDRIVLADFPLPVGCCTRGNVLAAPVAVDHHDVNDEELLGTRVSVVYEPTSHLTITPSFFYQRITQGGPNTFDSDPGTEAHYQPFDVREPFSDRFWLWSVTAQYRFEDFDLTSVTGDWNRKETITQDESENIQWAFGVPAYGIPQGGLGGSGIIEIDPSHQFSEEFRATSSGDTAFKWLVGVFYSDFSSNWNLFAQVPGLVPTFGYNSNDLISQYQPTKIKQTAVFGEASYEVFDHWTLTAGLRWFTYDDSLLTTVNGFVSPNGSTMNQMFGGTASDRGYNPKLNISYEPDDDLTLYAQLAKGFRPGGANEPIPTSGGLGAECTANLQSYGLASAPESFKPDTLWSYELGEKARLFGDRVTVNGAGYFETWEGVQQEVSLPCGFPFEINAGDANIWGSEIEVNAAVTDHLLLSLSGAYTDAYLVTNALNGLLRSGDRLQDVPPWTANQSLSYTTPVWNDWSLTARIENQYVGTRVDTTYYQFNHLPVYDLVNIRAGLNGSNWTVYLFMNNVFNKQAWLADNNSLSINVPTFNRVSTNQPRTIGIDLTYSFLP